MVIGSRFVGVWAIFSTSLLIWHFLNARSVECDGLQRRNKKLHGTSANSKHKGSCWCSADDYCLCTPALSVDVILITPAADALLMVERQDGRGFAIVGGFVQVGESAEAAAHREVAEETGLKLQELKQFHVFSDPSRDPRRHE